jgi:putative FmdB family regulatory protein
MPAYEYRCCACGNVFDSVVPAANVATEVVLCPKCGSTSKRRFTPPQAWRGAWSRQQDPERLRRTKELWE